MNAELKKLLKLAEEGKATATERLTLARLLEADARDEAKNEIANKIKQLKEKAVELGLTDQQIIESFKPAPVVMIEYTDKSGNFHQRFKGDKGKAPLWIGEIKTNYTEEQAKEKFAKNEDGKAFFKKLYNPK